MRPLPPPDAGGASSQAQHGVLAGLFFNPSLMSALLGCLIAQLAKPFVHWHTSGKQQLDWFLALSPGGMPSSHTASAMALTTTLGLIAGTNSTMFALAALFTLVVAYDATGVRLHAGRHAALLNIMIAHLPSEHPAADTLQLQETLGHTPQQVAAGAGVGLAVGALVTGVWSLSGG